MKRALPPLVIVAGGDSGVVGVLGEPPHSPGYPYLRIRHELVIMLSPLVVVGGEVLVVVASVVVESELVHPDHA